MSSNDKFLVIFCLVVFLAYPAARVGAWGLAVLAALLIAIIYAPGDRHD